MPRRGYEPARALIRQLNSNVQLGAIRGACHRAALWGNRDRADAPGQVDTVVDGSAGNAIHHPPGRWRPQQRRRLAAKRVGDCTSVHNQFLNRPHQANKFKTCCHIARLSKADEAIGCVVPVALGQIAPGYRPRCDHPAISAPPSGISSNSAKNTAIPDNHQIELVAKAG
jgi:hypothetical protein